MLKDKIDQNLLQLYSFLECQNQKFSNIIARENLEKIHYIESFGKYLCSLKLKDKEVFLTPAPCLHVYPFLKNCKTLKNITTRNYCFRDEDTVDENIRKNEFEMREFVVFATTFKELDEIRSRAIVVFENWLKDIGVQYSIEVATDHFSDPENKLKIFQEMNNMKYEFIVSVATEKFSIASFNHHGSHFTYIFDLCSDNSSVVSGCFAFGLDRLEYFLANLD